MPILLHAYKAVAIFLRTTNICEDIWIHNKMAEPIERDGGVKMR